MACGKSHLTWIVICQNDTAFFTSIWTACKWIINWDRHFKLSFTETCQKIKYRKIDLIPKSLLRFSVWAFIDFLFIFFFLLEIGFFLNRLNLCKINYSIGIHSIKFVILFIIWPFSICQSSTLFLILLIIFLEIHRLPTLYSLITNTPELNIVFNICLIIFVTNFYSYLPNVIWSRLELSYVHSVVRRSPGNARTVLGNRRYSW